MRTPLKAIRAKCVECSAGNTKEVQLCPIKACALFTPTASISYRPRRRKRERKFKRGGDPDV